jgi:two-component system cell cycle sensor histidine kinase/response regulator CckA
LVSLIRGPRLRILLVEDDEAYAAFVRAALAAGDEPPDLLRAADLAAAIACIGRTDADAVLLDLNLPDSRGLDTLRALLAAAPHMPVVVLTGVSDAALARDALRLGAQDWMVKGQLDPELVQRAVRYAVERKQLADRLVQAQKLEIAGRLANGMAHEFNNVLTAITGSAHLVEQAEDEETRGQALELLRRAARQGVALSRQLLSMARNPPMNDEVVDIGTLVEQSRLLVQAVLPSAIELEVGPLESVPVRIDPGQFDQLLLNLVINARDAMPGGGTLRISIRADRRPPPQPSAEPASDRSYAVVRVADTGAGIDPSILPRLFEPFFTTKGVRGTGLGLAIVAEIVGRFGGVVEVDSRLGQGTTFEVWLPAAA